MKLTPEQKKLKKLIINNAIVNKVICIDDQPADGEMVGNDWPHVGGIYDIDQQGMMVTMTPMGPVPIPVVSLKQGDKQLQPNGIGEPPYMVLFRFQNVQWSNN